MHPTHARVAAQDNQQAHTNKNTHSHPCAPTPPGKDVAPRAAEGLGQAVAAAAAAAAAERSVSGCG